MQSRSFPRTLVFLVIAIAVVNAFAEHYYWYWLMRWFDMPMHFLGGVWVAGAVLWWRFFSGRFPLVKPAGAALFLWAILGALGVGILWEAYEAIVSYVTVGHINAWADTLSDLGFDTLGGLITTGIVGARMSNKK